MASDADNSGVGNFVMTDGTAAISGTTMTVRGVGTTVENMTAGTDMSLFAGSGGMLINGTLTTIAGNIGQHHRGFRRRSDGCGQLGGDVGRHGMDAGGRRHGHQRKRDRCFGCRT